MTDSRTVRSVTIAVWVLAVGALVALAFVRAPQVQQISDVKTDGAVLAGALPIVYEFSTDT
jgi:hypothetical protein